MYNPRDNYFETSKLITLLVSVLHNHNRLMEYISTLADTWYVENIQNASAF